MWANLGVEQDEQCRESWSKFQHNSEGASTKSCLI